jgi:hypothetical protein
LQRHGNRHEAGQRRERSNRMDERQSAQYPLPVA